MKKYHFSFIKTIFFILLILISSYFFIKFFLYKENIENEKQNRGLLLLFGEAFREGNSTRTRDTEFGFSEQKLASDSHIEFCKHLKEKYGITMDVIINTYETKYENELRDWYKDYNLHYMKNKELIGFKLVQDACDTIDREKYDFVFITRMDILLKPYFLEIFDPMWDKVYFACQNYTLFNGNFNGTSSYCGFIEDKNTNIFPMVNPLLKFIPKKNFKILNNIYMDHDVWKHYIESNILENYDMNFIIDTYHDGDSNKDFNPLYKMVGRPENSVWHDEGKKIDRNLFGTKNNIVCNDN